MVYKNKGLRGDIKNIADTRVLTRIIIYLKEVKADDKTSIANKINVKDSKMKDAMNWLLNNKIIKKKFNIYTGKFDYTLNKEWVAIQSI